MPREGFTSVSIPDEMIQEVDEFLKTKTAKRLGIHSRADLVTKGLEKIMEELNPRFIHINTYEDHHDIYDMEKKRLVSVYFKPDGVAWCNIDETTDCQHITSTLENPEVEKQLKDRGWKHKNRDNK